jgi:hypothetical protein
MAFRGSNRPGRPEPERRLVRMDRIPQWPLGEKRYAPRADRGVEVPIFETGRTLRGDRRSSNRVKVERDVKARSRPRARTGSRSAGGSKRKSAR